MSGFKGPRVKPLLIGENKLPSPQELLGRLELAEGILIALLERDNLSIGILDDKVVLVDRATLPTEAPADNNELTMTVIDEDVAPTETVVVP
jgi:hypothetical protein